MRYPDSVFTKLDQDQQLRIIYKTAKRLELNENEKSIREELSAYIAIAAPVELKRWNGLEVDELLALTERQLGISVRDDQLSRQLHVRENDRVELKGEKMPLRLMLHDLRSAFNVGAVFRVAECVGVEKVFLSGYTPSPLQPQILKTAMGTEQAMAWQHLGIDELTEKRGGGQVVAFETVENCPSLYEFEFSPGAERPYTFIFGNERRGLPQETLKRVDQVVHIPVYGMKNSLNVGMACALACYEFRRQYEKTREAACR